MWQGEVGPRMTEQRQCTAELGGARALFSPVRRGRGKVEISTVAAACRQVRSGGCGVRQSAVRRRRCLALSRGSRAMLWTVRWWLRRLRRLRRWVQYVHCEEPFGGAEVVIGTVSRWRGDVWYGAGLIGSARVMRGPAEPGRGFVLLSDVSRMCSPVWCCGCRAKYSGVVAGS